MMVPLARMMLVSMAFATTFQSAAMITTLVPMTDVQTPLVATTILSAVMMAVPVLPILAIPPAAANT